MEPRPRSDPGFGYGPPRYPGTFLLAFREALAGLDWKARRWLGHAVECADAAGGTRVVGLENLYRRLRGGDRSEWPGQIAAFLQTALGAEGDAELPTRLADVGGQLLVRLGPPLRPESGEPRVWSRPIEGTDLVVNLVVDYPERMVYVSEPMVAESGRGGDEWLAKALDNLRGRSDADAFEVVHDESGMLLCNVADAYDSSRALLLDALLPEHRADGYFAAVPSRDQLLVLPVTRRSFAFVFLLKQLAERNHKNAPYPISSDVYWVRDGKWHRFRVEVQGERVVLEPPEEFGDVLQRLAPDELPGDEADEPDETDE